MFRASVSLLALSAVLAAQAQTRPHDFDLLDVKWHVTLDEPTASLIGDVTNTLKPKAGTESIELDFGGLTVDEITVDGTVAQYSHKAPLLRITLPKPAAGDKPMAVRIKYHGVPQTGVYFVPAKRAFPAKTPVVYTQGEMIDTRSWLPTWDWPDDKATSEGTIDVPEGWYALSNGKLVNQTTDAGRTKFHWKMDQAHVTYLISFAAGPFDEGKEEWSGIPVNYYVPQGLKSQGEAAFGGTADVVRFFSELTGFKYPYAKYTQSAVPDFMFGGMENITATTQTINTLHPANCGHLRDSLGLVAHELAHQWFGDTVTCSGWSDAWINEGWATFLPNFYFREKRGQDSFDIGRYDIFQGGLGAHSNAPHRGVVFNGYKEPLDMFDGFIYAGGAARMFMLMNDVGEKKFWAATKAYLDERKYTSFDTHAFFETWSKNLGKDLSEFKKQWFFTAGAPRLTVSQEGQTLTVTQMAPFFNLDVPVWTRANGTWNKQRIKISGERSTLELSKGGAALLDPECQLMAEITNKIPFTNEQLIDLFKNAPNAGEQARMIDSMLGPITGPEAIAVAKTIQSPLILQRFIRFLREGSEGYLVELTKHADPRVADTALRRMGDLPMQTDTLARVKEIVASSPNEALKLSAVRILLNATKDEAYAEELWKSESLEDEHRQIALDWWRANNPDLARTRALEAIEQNLPEPTRVSAIRHLGGLKDKPGERKVYETLAALLKEPSFGARNTAINAIADYGDKAAIPLLEVFNNHELVFFRQSAKGAIERLKAAS